MPRHRLRTPTWTGLSGALLWLCAPAAAQEIDPPDELAAWIAADPTAAGTALAPLASNPALLYSDPRARVIDPRALELFRSGPRQARATIGLLLRSLLEVPWPARRITTVLGRGDADPLAELALSESLRPGRQMPAVSLETLFDAQPRVALRLLQRSTNAPPATIVARLVERLAGAAPSTGLELVPILMRCEVGRAAIIEHIDRLPRDQQLLTLARAGADLSPEAARIAAALQRWLDLGGTHAVHPAVLRALPWHDPNAELAPIAELIQQLWRGTDREGRTSMLPVLAAIGAQARFATDDLLARLDDGNDWQHAAKTLLALDQLQRVHTALLRHLAAAPPRRLDFAYEEVHTAWLHALVDYVTGAEDADLLDRLAAARLNNDFTESQRSAIAARLLVYFARVGGVVAAHRLRGIVGELLPRTRERLAPIRDELVRFVIDAGDTRLAKAIGERLGRAGIAPPDTVLAMLQDNRQRPFACHLLAGFGPAAAGAVDAVEALARDSRIDRRFLGAHVLAHLGPAGVGRLGVLVQQHREFISLLDGVFDHGDDASMTAAANVLLSLRLDPNATRAGQLRRALALCQRKKTRAMLTLALLTAEPRITAADWLQIANLEPAVFRRRAIESLASRADSDIALGALAESLDDVDRRVREAALAVLLQAPQRTQRCRQALQESLVANRWRPQTAARLRAVLAEPATTSDGR